MPKPLCIDLFCGLGGWTEGFLAEGWDVIGFDIERHRYPARALADSDGVKAGNIIWDPQHPDFKGETFHSANEKRLRECPLTGGWNEYPAQLVLQDVLTLHGRQFQDVDCIVASPPCQEFSYMAMPWSRAKQIAGGLREEVPFPEPYTGSRTVSQLTALFDACFRIQREACEATCHCSCWRCARGSHCVRCDCFHNTGVIARHIPMVVENVKGAQPWVGPAKANFGSFYFWGDIAMVGGAVVAGPLQFGNVAKATRRTRKQAGRNFHFPEKYGIPSPSFHGAEREESVAATAELVGTKNAGGSWFDVAHNTESGTGRNPVNGSKGFATGLGMGHGWRQDPSARFNSKSDSRKAASAQIAKIPLPLSSYIARCFRPAGPTASERSA